MIDSFSELSTIFFIQHVVLMEKDKSDSGLWNLSLGPPKPLYNCNAKYKEVIARVPCISQTTSLSLLSNGVWHMFRCSKEHTVNRSVTIQVSYSKLTIR